MPSIICVSAIITDMILVTGATGFIGSALVKKLIGAGYEVRVLLRPSRKSPNLPRGVPMEVAVSSLRDERGMLAALRGIRVVFHLASAERDSKMAHFENRDVDNASVLVKAAKQTGVQRLFYLSHLSADKNSFFQIYRTKAFVESVIKESGLSYTIYRTSVVFGPSDNFTTYLLHALRSSAAFFLVPGNDNVNLQPLWIGDLINCLLMSLKGKNMANTLKEIGGGEYFTLKEILRIIMAQTSVRRLLISLAPAYMRTINLWLGQSNHSFLISNFWLDYLAYDCTCALDTLPQLFGILPVRFERKLNYLKGWK